MSKFWRGQLRRVLIVAALSAMMLSSIATIAVGVAFYEPSTETAGSEQTSSVGNSLFIRR